MSSRLYRFGPFQLDIAEQVLLRDGQSLSLKPKVFNVLAVLVENSGRVVRKDELMQRVWADSFVEEGNLAVSIFEIRKALGEGQNGHRYIETVPRRGYRFLATVSTTALPLITSDGNGLISTTSIVSPFIEGDQSTSKGSIAVLPFRFIGASGNEYLGLGMADALITRLSNLRQITVRPTSAVRKYNGAQDSVSVGKKLGVKWVLDGSVQKTRTRIRATVQLVHIADGELLWAEKFDEKFTDILAVEDSISEQVANALAPKLTGEEKKALSRRHTESPEAYASYLRGRYFLDKRTTEGCLKGLQYFEQAIAVDPNYALAYSGIAGCYIVLGSYTIDSQLSYQNAERAILRSISLDDQLAEAHGLLGHLRTRKWDWTGAEKELKRAIELNPNFANAHAWYSILLAVVGRFDESFKEIRNAQSLDPVSPIIETAEGSIFYFAHRFDEAITRLRRALDLDAGFALAQSFLGFAYEALGNYDEALNQYHKAKSTLGNLPEINACLGRVHALAGKPNRAKQVIDELKNQTSKRIGNPSLIAMIYTALGDQEQAFNWFEKAFEAHDPDLCVLKVDPRLDSLRADDRFDSLLRRVGLAE